MNSSKRIHRPTIESWASVDAVLCYPATTPNEYILFQVMDWWYDYDRVGRYHGSMKKEILESLTDKELREMIAEKRRNVEFNEKLVHYKPSGKEWEVLFHMTAWLNEVYITRLNEPLIKCILLMDRELRQRSDDKKTSKIDLAELKNRVDILEVVQAYTNIWRYKPGQLIKCPLPDHKDKTASCMIYQKTNQWHCHGCHQWWSQIDFIMLMTWCSISDAIKKLSNF